MGDNILADHLGRYAVLSDAERECLGAIDRVEREYKRGSVIRAEHGPPGDILVLRTGWLFCAAMLEDGRRQITRLHFRGDLLGTDALAFAEAPNAVVALTDAELCVIDRARLGELFTTHPRLAALLFAAQQIDRVTLTDRLISLGRNSAKGRVASLLLWIAERLRIAGENPDLGFALPMTQEEIGDMTGLTAVHVNRTMRVLAEQGLIARSGSTIRLIEPDRLALIANHIRRNERVDQSWLPAGR